MKEKKLSIVSGFNLYLEHVLEFGSVHEKGRMTLAPKVQLGSGAWNILKTLEHLGVSTKQLRLIALGGPQADPDTQAQKTLLQKEKISTTFLAARENPATSYYCIPAKGKSFAFGYDGGAITSSSEIKNTIARVSKYADIKIITEIGSSEQEINFAKSLLYAGTNKGVSVLIPSRSLLASGKLKKLTSGLTLLSMNEEEALLALKTKPTVSTVAKFSTPYCLVTLGKRGALLKVGKEVFSASVQAVKPKYEGGAGDATTAALLYALFIAGMDPQAALNFAMKVGKETLSLPTPYWTKKK